MVAEGIHSVVDTGDGLLLLLGKRRSALEPDEEHPFGHGKEVYFWSFVVSILIFALGGGFALYEGIHSLRNPEPIEAVTWNYAILAAAILFEGTALLISLRHFRKSGPTKGNLFKRIVKSKDAATMAIIIEDSAAVVGLLIALAGIFLSTALEKPIFDGISSVAIGLLLLTVATFLAVESKALLLGEAAQPEVLRQVDTLLKSAPDIKNWRRPRSMHFGPENILLVVEISFHRGVGLQDAEKSIEALRKQIHEQCPEIQWVYLHPIGLSPMEKRPS